MNLLKELYNLPRQSVYALENVLDKRVYIGYAFDTKAALMRNIGLIQENRHPIKDPIENITLRILEYTADPFLCTIHMERYKQEGWELYRDRKPVNPKLKMVTQFDDTYELVKIVYIETGGRNKIILGMFGHEKSAQAFIDQVPIVNGVPLPFIAINTETKNYWLDKHNLGKLKEMLLDK